MIDEQNLVEPTLKEIRTIQGQRKEKEKETSHLNSPFAQLPQMSGRNAFRTADKTDKRECVAIAPRANRPTRAIRSTPRENSTALRLTPSRARTRRCRSCIAVAIAIAAAIVVVVGGAGHRRRRVRERVPIAVRIAFRRLALQTAIARLTQRHFRRHRLRRLWRRQRRGRAK